MNWLFGFDHAETHLTWLLMSASWDFSFKQWAPLLNEWQNWVIKVCELKLQDVHGALRSFVKEEIKGRINTVVKKNWCFDNFTIINAYAQSQYFAVLCVLDSIMSTSGSLKYT